MAKKPPWKCLLTQIQIDDDFNVKDIFQNAENVIQVVHAKLQHDNGAIWQHCYAVLMDTVCTLMDIVWTLRLWLGKKSKHQ